MKKILMPLPAIAALLLMIAWMAGLFAEKIPPGMNAVAPAGTGEPVAVPARVGEDYRSEWMNDGLKPVHTVTELAENSIYPAQPGAEGVRATAIEFEARRGPEYWLGWHNFYVITRYNHSSMYAMCVYQLSRQIEAQRSR